MPRLPSLGQLANSCNNRLLLGGHAPLCGHSAKRMSRRKSSLCLECLENIKLPLAILRKLFIFSGRKVAQRDEVKGGKSAQNIICGLGLCNRNCTPMVLLDQGGLIDKEATIHTGCGGCA